MDPALLEKLQALRDSYGKGIVISSGFRCEAHNKQLGGVPQSLHLVGKAVDCMTVSGDERYVFIKKAMELGFTGIGIASRFVHLDVRSGTPMFWKYLDK
jgi:uncharacterized protein YcbK (DUF882 family)